MLSIQYLPYHSLKTMDFDKRIDTILSYVRNDRIIIIDGKLNSRDEATLIRETMSQINDYGFHGMELCVLHDGGHKEAISRTKHRVANIITGRRPGLTIIGPASIIQEMRQYPDNMVIHFNEEYIQKNAKRNTYAKKTSRKYKR